MFRNSQGLSLPNIHPPLIPGELCFDRLPKTPCSCEMDAARVACQVLPELYRVWASDIYNTRKNPKRRNPGIPLRSAKGVLLWRLRAHGGLPSVSVFASLPPSRFFIPVLSFITFSGLQGGWPTSELGLQGANQTAAWNRHNH